MQSCCAKLTKKLCSYKIKKNRWGVGFVNKVKNGALMVIVGTLAYFFLGVMYVWSVLRIEVSKVFPEYTAAQLSFCFTLMMSTFCIGGFVGGKIVHKKSPALSLRIGSLLICIAVSVAWAVVYNVVGTHLLNKCDVY